MRKVRSVLLSVLASATIGCGDSSSLTPEPQYRPLPEGMALSNATSSSAAAMRGALAGQVAGDVYLSAAPGTFPSATGGTVRHAGTGASVTLTILDGGFDPVTIRASEGDLLILTIHQAQASVIEYAAVVPPRKRPVIVRTNPPRGSVDVPVNRSVDVVFSEPVDAATLNTASLFVSGEDGVVAGTLLRSADGLVVTFTPASALSPNVLHTISARGISDFDGDKLEATFTATFRTAVSAVGSILVNVTTTGGIDADGYQLSLHDGPAVNIGANASHEFNNVTTGPRDVSLSGIATHCAVGVADVRDVQVVAGNSVTVNFAVQCTSIGGLTLKTATSGTHLDQNGYLLSIDGGPPQRFAATQSIFVPLSDGTHTVKVTDVAANCALNVHTWGGNAEQRTIRVPFSSSRDAEFQFTCGAPTAALTVRMTTTGSRQDANGYAISMDGRAPQQVSTNFAQTFSGIATGRHSISVTEIHEDCIVLGSTLVFVDIMPGATHDMAFNVVCETAAVPTRVVAFASSRDGNEEIYVGNSDGSGIIRLTDHPARDYAPSWSPDGTRIAFISDRTGASDLFLMDADGSNLERCNHVNIGDKLSWSPDGTRIALTSLDNGSAGIYAVDVSRCAEPKQSLLDYPGSDYSPTWNRDGRIAFLSDYAYYDGVSELYLMNSNGSNVVRIKPFVTPLREIYYDPAWSPSGERMLVGACAELWERCDAGRLHILDANGTTQQSIGASGLSAQWSPDGDVLAYVSRRCYFGCQPSIRYVLLDGSGRSGLMFANAHSPSWRPN